MHLYKKFKRIYVCNRIIRLQAHSLYEKQNTQTSAVQQPYITCWYAGLMFTTDKKKTILYAPFQLCLFPLRLVSLDF
jgi:hypothetical protein